MQNWVISGQSQWISSEMSQGVGRQSLRRGYHQSGGARWRGIPLMLFILTAGLLLGGMKAGAVTRQCADLNLNSCTANEVFPSGDPTDLEVADGDRCDSPDDTINVRFKIPFSVQGGVKRYDLGAVFGSQPGTPPTSGSCDAELLASDTNIDFDGDQCSDIEGEDNIYTVDGFVTVPCTPTGECEEGGSQIKIPFCTFWYQPTGDLGVPNCTDAEDVLAGAVCGGAAT